MAEMRAGNWAERLADRMVAQKAADWVVRLVDCLAVYLVVHSAVRRVASKVAGWAAR